MTSDTQEETSTGTGVDFQDEDKLDATSIHKGRPESSQTITLAGAKTDSPFFIRDLSFTHEEEKRIIRIIDTRLFRWFTFSSWKWFFLVHLYRSYDPVVHVRTQHASHLKFILRESLQLTSKHSSLLGIELTIPTPFPTTSLQTSVSP
jgi:hypothetical protein